MDPLRNLKNSALQEKVPKGAVIKNGTEGGGRDFKIHCEIMKPNARNRNYLHSSLTSTKMI